MRRSLSTLISFFLFSLFFATPSSFAEIKPEFCNTSVSLKAFAGESINLDLKTILCKGAELELAWAAFPPAQVPSWVDKDQLKNGFLRGTPPKRNPQPNTFNLLVTQKGIDEGNIAQTRIFVKQRPRFLQNPIDLGFATEEKPYSFETNKASLIDNPEGYDLSFSVSGTPSWLSMDSKGTFTGTPQDGDEGKYSGLQITATYEDGTFEAGARGEVLNLNKPPFWLADPSLLPEAKEDVAYRVDLKSFVQDPDNDPVTFIAVNVPSWLTLTSAGILSGTPRKAQVGQVQLRMKVTDNISGTNEGAQQFTVVETNHPPVWNLDPINLGSILEDSSFTYNIAQHASDVDGDNLTFKMVSGPSWLTLSPAGALSGTPRKKDIGNFTAVVEVSDGEFNPKAGLIGIVVEVNHAPFWKEDPITLPSGTEDVIYSQSIANYADDIDLPNDTLTFEKVSGPNWIRVAAGGQVTANPTRPQVGQHTFQVRVKDKEGLSATATVRVEIKKVNKSPVWDTDPIDVGRAFENKAFSYDLSKHASDIDGDTLSFKKVGGPSWWTISDKGILSGTPGSNDVGQFTGSVEVSDGEFSPQAGIIGVVINVNQPPVWTQDPIKLPNGTEDIAYSQGLSEFATDPDLPQDTLTFRKVSGPAWINVDSQGRVTGLPTRPEVGLHKFKVEVKDAEGLSAQVNVEVTVDKVNKPPVWLQDPIDLGKILEDSNYTFDLKTVVKDLDGDPLSFGKVSGPTWLKVSSDGTLSGTPKADDLGNFKASFRVSDGQFIVEVGAFGEVIHVNHPPSWIQDPIVLSAVDELVAMNQVIAGFATDPDPNDTLSFTKVTGPGWITVSSDGIVTGVPPQEGTFEFTVQVQDQGGLTAPKPVTVRLPVNDVNRPPVWKEDPINLGKVLEDSNFSFDLTSKVSDPDGDTLTFNLIAGPAWLKLSPTGQLSGVPSAGDTGNYTATFEVSDGEYKPQAGGIGEVVAKNKPPTIDVSQLNFIVKEREPYSTNLVATGVVTDIDGDTLEFSLKESPDWVSLTREGNLQINARFEHISPPVHNFTLEVTDKVNSKVSGLMTITVLRNPRPPEWTKQTLVFETLVDKVFTQELQSFVSDPDGQALTFTKQSGPSWLEVSSAGVLQGTPRTEQLGENTFVVRATNPDPSTADVTVIIKVLTDNLPPYWTQNPLKLKDGIPGQSYTERVDGYAKDPDNDPLKFKKVSGANWVFVTEGGLLIGTPPQGLTGISEVVVRTEDPKGLYADTTVQINLGKKNECPKWTADPILLGEIAIDKIFNFDLSAFVSDPDGPRLRFERVVGPLWLNTSEDGILVGTPKLSDVGSFTAIFSVSDGICNGAQVGATGTVVAPSENKPPVIADLLFVVEEGSVENFNLSDPQYVTDPEGDPMQFRLEETASWIALSSAGNLIIAPSAAQLGDHSFTLTVTDSNNNTTQGPLRVKVVPVNPDILPPVWLENPIRMKADVDKLVSSNVSQKAMDQNSPPLIPLSFTKVSGPQWLEMAPNGAISGTPRAGDKGVNTFVLRVFNTAGLSADTVLLIDVDSGGEHEDSVQIDEAVPGAQSENTWILDNTCKSASLMRQIQTHIGVLYDRLDAAQIHYSHIVTGTTGYYLGKAVPDRGQDEVLTWQDSNPARSFNQRLSRIGGLWCKNAPIWSFFKLLESAPSLPFYQREFFMEKVAADAIIVSQQLGYTRQYSRFTPQANWSPSDFGNNFIQFFERRKQPFRMNAFAPKCNTGSAGQPTYYPVSGLDIEPPDNAYGTIVEMTEGKYWPACKVPVDEVLREYADELIFRAYVTAKKKIVLSQRPLDSFQIRVTVGNLSLQNPSQWVYLPAENAVALFWENIPMESLLPGDKIRIKYLY